LPPGLLAQLNEMALPELACEPKKAERGERETSRQRSAWEIYAGFSH